MAKKRKKPNLRANTKNPNNRLYWLDQLNQMKQNAPAEVDESGIYFAGMEP